MFVSEGNRMAAAKNTKTMYRFSNRNENNISVEGCKYLSEAQ